MYFVPKRMKLKIRYENRTESSLYHIVVNHDRTVSSPATEVYVNGVQETSFQTSTNPSQNGTSFFNKASQSSLIGKMVVEANFLMVIFVKQFG